MSEPPAVHDSDADESTVAESLTQRFDTVLKELMRRDLRAWLVGLGLIKPSVAVVEPISGELRAVVRFADRVIRIRDRPQWDLHLELQTDYDPKLPTRLLEYNVLIDAHNQFANPVRTVVVLLRRQAAGRQLNGRVRRRSPDGATYLDFAYDIVRLWELSTRPLLDGPLAVTPLAPLTNVTASGLPEVLQAMQRRIAVEASAAQAESIWVATYILLGLRYSTQTVDRLLRGVLEMRGSSTLNALLERGRTEGLSQGRALGAQELLINLGAAQFGPPDQAVRDRIGVITDMATLSALARRVPRVASWSELLAE